MNWQDFSQPMDEVEYEETRNGSSGGAAVEAGTVPQIWAVGGGKGGVGKSVVSTNLGLALTKLGKRCVLIDADLGGANLHTLLGISHPQKSLADFLSRRVENLSEVLVPTPVSELQLISGTRALMEMANPGHAQKMRILRQLNTLDTDVVILDLGAGTSFNVLDFFLVAHEKLMVVVPTPTSIENAYYFLKAVFFRQLKRAVRSAGTAHAVEKAVMGRLMRGIRYPSDLVASIKEIDEKAGEAVARELGTFAPRLIVNQIRRPEERRLGEEMSLACRDLFGIEMECLGSIRHDECVLQAIQTKRPAVDSFPASTFTASIQGIVRRLVGS